MIRSSLDPGENLDNARKAGESTGKSGSFFFFSKDRRFIIKTMFEAELDVFLYTLGDYFRHLEQGDSLLARIYGVFQIRMKGIIPINFILMANTIKAKIPKHLKCFDLKGSMINRKVVRGEG